MFINLINDSLPAIAIGIDQKISSNKDILKPRNVNDGILTKRVVKRISVEGLIIALCCIFSFHIGYITNIYVARTMVFVTISIARLFYSFNCIGRFSIFKRRSKNRFNKALFTSIIVGLSLILFLLFVPQVYNLFSIAKLNKLEIFICFGLGFIPLLSIQILFIIREFRYNRH